VRIVSQRGDSRIVEAVPSFFLGVESESGVVSSRETSVMLIDSVCKGKDGEKKSQVRTWTRLKLFKRN